VAGDFGPGDVPDQTLSATFSPYVMVAAGVAADRGQEDAAELLGDPGDVEVVFSDNPVTAHGEQMLVAVEVTLHTEREAADDLPARLAVLLSETAQPDGYCVRRVQVQAPGS
jgi:hypothetical protein